MLTLNQLTERSGLDVLDHLELDAEIPVLAGLQAQGDLLIVPVAELAGQVRIPDGARWNPVPDSGVEVLRGTAMGNPHTLVADAGVCEWTTDVHDDAELAIGVLKASAPVHLLHREHGAAGIAPGMYVIRRQMEQADQIRYVED